MSGCGSTADKLLPALQSYVIYFYLSYPHTSLTGEQG